ncbi:uncharacterized protein LOC132474148 [Gadus macrocephalus]|uniref:uncharacterized protein LOC132474148 n=1 Tax=Gadus macrocephalus TaxID=80720 RepID=UPI0028CB810B|nr:uncharacterized protein LOC132474148 [Gadus macrocephalus]
MIEKLGRVVGLAAAVRDDGASRGDFEGLTPGHRLFMYFGQHVEEPGPGLGIPQKVIALFVRNVFFSPKGVNQFKDHRNGLSIYGSLKFGVIARIVQLPVALPYILRPIHDDNSAAFIGGLDDYVFVSNQLSESLRLLGEEVSGDRVDPKGVSVIQEVITDQTRHLNRDIIIWRNPRRLNQFADLGVDGGLRQNRGGMTEGRARVAVDLKTSHQQVE